MSENGPGELSIFNYARNLRIVGTYHALNDSDARTLEHLIGESDFVALEYDDGRLQRKGVFEVIPSIFKRGYSPEREAFYASDLQTLYLRAFSFLNQMAVRKANRKFKERARDCSMNEFHFCQEISQKRGKSVYLVDMPAHVLVEKLLQLPYSVQLRHLAAFLRLANRPKEVDDILFTQREDYMLKEITKHEGPIADLERKGILVVGLTHARNYAKRKIV